MTRCALVFAAMLLMGLLCVPGLFAQAQATTGTIAGLIVDETGAVLPGVTVTLKNTATNFERVVVTGDNGRFRAPLIPLGPYTITATLEGFATMVREGLTLVLGQQISLDLTLQVSAVEQEILVTAEAPLIEVTRARNQIRIDDRAVEGLPNNNRNFLEFSKLTPGVTTVQGPDGDELSINGQKGINNNVMVDGADFNNPFFGEQRGGQRPAFTFNIDAIKEVLIVTDGAPAEYGRSSGGFINVVTKSGTNEYTGSAHLFYKNDSLSASPKLPGGGTEPDFSFNQVQYGFTFGGAIKQDKLFIFAALDSQDADETKQTDPGRIDPEVVAFLDSVGLSNENGPIDRTNDGDAYLVKLDWAASERSLVTARWAYHYSNQINGTFDVDSWGVSANAIEKDYSHTLAATWITTLSDSLLNEFRGQIAKEWRPRPYEGPDVPGQSRPFPDTAFDFGGGWRVGMPFFIPVEYDDDRLQLVNNVSLLKGNHSMKAGIEWNDVTSSQTFIGFANGRYIFSSFDGFRNYVNLGPSYVECSDGSSSASGSCPGGSDIVGPLLLYLQQAGVGGLTVVEAGTQDIEQKELALFVQDQWQPIPNLTLDYGLRWERLDMPDPITPPDEVFFAPFIGQTVETEFGPQKFPSNGLIPDVDQWQPRFALAWTPKGKGDRVLRANIGIFNARIPALSIASTRSTNGSVGQTIFQASFFNGFGVTPPTWPNLIPDANIGDPFFPDVFVFDEDFETPRTTASAISWEQEFIPNYAFLFKLNYAKTDNITRFINRNDPLFGAPWSSGLGEDGQNGLTVLTSVESTARSEYFGATVGVNKRLSNGFSFQAYYTYSKDESDDDNERDPFSFRYARADNLEPEFGYSDRHQRNRFNGWVLWNGPWGIDVNARYSYRDAQPAPITATGEFANTPQDRCSAVTAAGGCTVDSTVVRRNLGEKDNKFSSLDVRLSKNFRLGDWTLQAILDVFNLFNEENFLRPQVTNLIFNFDGTVQSGSGSPLQAQIGVRFLR